MKHTAAAGVLLVAALAGCGSGSSEQPKPINTAAMMSAMGYPGGHGKPAAQMVAAIKNYCDDSEDQMQMDIAIILDNGGTADLNRTRTGISYVCPDSLKKWDAASSEVASLS